MKENLEKRINDLKEKRRSELTMLAIGGVVVGCVAPALGIYALKILEGVHSSYIANGMDIKTVALGTVSACMILTASGMGAIYVLGAENILIRCGSIKREYKSLEGTQ